MSTRALYLRKGWINENAPLKNGLGRFIPQLARLTIKFCKERPTSAGVREFIERDAVGFAKENPHCALYLKPRRNRSPIIVAEYLNGERHWQPVVDVSRTELKEWLDLLRTASGREFQVQQKYSYSDHPSVQGVWHPFTNVDPALALASHPDPQSSEARGQPESATERVKRLFAEQASRRQQSGSEEEALNAAKQGSSE